MTNNLRMEVAEDDVHELTAAGHLSIAKEYLNMPLYDVRDLDSVCATHGGVIADIIGARVAWEEESISEDESARVLGLSGLEFDDVVASRGVPWGPGNRYRRDDIAALASDVTFLTSVYAKRTHAGIGPSLNISQVITSSGIREADLLAWPIVCGRIRQRLDVPQRTPSITREEAVAILSEMRDRDVLPAGRRVSATYDSCGRECREGDEDIFDDTLDERELCRRLCESVAEKWPVHLRRKEAEFLLNLLP